MKKLLVLMVAVTCCFGQQLFSQPEIVGSQEYGRIFNINYDLNVENRLYAITLGNHIVVSNDNGLNWEILYSYPEQNTALKSLRVMDGNKLSFFITNGNRNAVFVLDLVTLTIDKQFVLPIPQNSSKEWIQNYSIYEGNTDIAMVIQGYSVGSDNYVKVYYTVNAGTDWQEIYYNVSYNGVSPNNVAISPNDPNKLFITRGNGPNDVDGGLFISTDAGMNWVEKIPGNTYDPIVFNPGNPDDILVGTSIGYGTHEENLYRSLDGGNTWNVIPINWIDETLDNINAIVYNPSDLANIILLEENEMVITNDNFETFENIVYPVGGDTHSYYYGLTASFNPFNGNEVFVNSAFYPLFSTDGGVTLTWSKNPYFSTTGSVCLASGAENHLYYGVQFGYIHRDMATGIDTPYDVKPIDYMAISPGITVMVEPTLIGRVYKFIGSFMGSDLYVSDDHGATNTSVMNLFSNNLHCVATDPENSNVIWAAFSSFGENVQVYKIDFSDPNNITNSLITLPNTNIVNGIMFEKTNPDKIIITQGTSVYQSTDDGNNWESISSGLEELNPNQDVISQITNNPLNADQYTIATSKGIFTTLDQGGQWLKIYGSNIHNISYSGLTDKNIVAATHSSYISQFKLIYSTDGGTTWVEIAAEDLYHIASSATALYFVDNLAEVYIGSFDIGLVKYTIDLSGVGIDDNQYAKAEIMVYPNPTDGELNFKTDQPISSIEIYNVTGQLVYDAIDAIRINISHLENGLYFCNIFTIDGNNTVVKIVK